VFCLQRRRDEEKVNDKIPGYAEALRILQKYTSQRARKLQHLEKFVKGTQYEGLPDWFSDKKPLWERAPCIVYPIVKAAIDSNEDLLLGEGRFPEVRVDGQEGEEAEAFEDAIANIIRQSRFRQGAREVFTAGQGCGSACAIFGVRGGRLFIDTLLARWCKPELDIDGAVLSLEVKYPYLSLEKDANGEEKYVCKLYRRVIDSVQDITYLPAEARADGTEPRWTEDKSKTITHGLGYCPVVWYPHLQGCTAVNDFDGEAIHEHLTDEIRAHDFALSQRHRAALYAGDPQWTEIGVPPGYNPTGKGRKAVIPASLNGRPGEAYVGSYVEQMPQHDKARRKSPGEVWQYDGKNPEVKVELHTLPGDALKAIDDHAKDLLSKICTGLGVVFTTPESLPNESRLSGKALESFKAPQLARVNYYRTDFGDRFILPALGMLIRIAIDKKLPIKNLDAVKKVVQASEMWSWHAPPFDLVWGEYFQISGEEEELLMRASATALTAGFATTRGVVEQRKGILKVTDVNAYMAELETQREKAKQDEIELAKATKPAPAPGAPK
jgi:hypothetical protein